MFVDKIVKKTRLIKLPESDISAYWNQHFNSLKRRSFLWKRKTPFLQGWNTVKM